MKKNTDFALLTVLFFCITIIDAATNLRHVSYQSTDEEGRVEEIVIKKEENFPSHPAQIRLVICSNRCSEDCLTFNTPANKCFNGQNLFPNHAEVWGEYDVYDMVSLPKVEGNEPHIVDELNTGRRGEVTFTRYFFKTRDSSCDGHHFVDVSKATDKYVLPLQRCVGPFGPPRPWGTFEFITEHGEGLDPLIYFNTQ